MDYTRLVQISNENPNDICQYHPTCFVCAVCDKQIDNEPYIKHPRFRHVYYHSNCYSLSESYNPNQIIDSNLSSSDDEQINLELVLLESKRTYELEIKSNQFQDYSHSDQDFYSSSKHQYKKEDLWDDEELARALSVTTFESHQSPSLTQNDMYLPFSLADEGRQLAKGLRLSVSNIGTIHDIDKVNQFSHNNSNPVQTRKPCSICQNTFNKQHELEEHAQLHFDN